MIELPRAPMRRGLEEIRCSPVCGDRVEHQRGRRARRRTRLLGTSARLRGSATVDSHYALRCARTNRGGRAGFSPQPQPPLRTAPRVVAGDDRTARRVCGFNCGMCLPRLIPPVEKHRPSLGGAGFEASQTVSDASPRQRQEGRLRTEAEPPGRAACPTRGHADARSPRSRSGSLGPLLQPQPAHHSGARFPTGARSPVSLRRPSG